MAHAEEPVSKARAKEQKKENKEQREEETACIHSGFFFPLFSPLGALGVLCALARAFARGV